MIQLLASSHALAACLFILIVIADAVLATIIARSAGPTGSLNSSFSGVLGTPLVVVTYLVRDTPHQGYTFRYATSAPPAEVYTGVMIAAYLGLAFFHIGLAYGLRKRYSWARWAQILWLIVWTPGTVYHLSRVSRWGSQIFQDGVIAIAITLLTSIPILIFLFDARTSVLFTRSGQSCPPHRRGRAFRFELVFGIVLIPLFALGLWLVDVFGPLVLWARFAIWFAETRVFF